MTTPSEVKLDTSKLEPNHTNHSALPKTKALDLLVSQVTAISETKSRQDTLAYLGSKDNWQLVPAR
jgi:hypothetical protein